MLNNFIGGTINATNTSTLESLVINRTGATALAFAASASLAQTFPSKPIRWVVPSSAGGGNDQLARLFGAKMTQNWGQQVIVDLRPGAAGIVGSEIVAKAPPDGYTILIVATGYSLNPSLYATLPYDTLNDFARVTLLAYSPNVLVVHPSLPVNNVREFIALARARPGQLTAGTAAGNSAYLAVEMLKSMAKIDAVNIPYKGAGQALTDLVAGRPCGTPTCRSSPGFPPPGRPWRGGARYPRGSAGGRRPQCRRRCRSWRGRAGGSGSA